jgi:hypothetical protein
MTDSGGFARGTRPFSEGELLWIDLWDLNFWLWVCLHDANEYLKSDREFLTALDKLSEHPLGQEAMQQRMQQKLAAQRIKELKKYHFVMAMGSLVRRLDRLVLKFPEMKAAYDAAQHLRIEGLYLRNMIEHADTNVQAMVKGAPRGGFVRKSPAGADL